MDGALKLIKKHYFKQSHSNVTTADFHKTSNLLLAGFSSGVFGLYELRDGELNNIHVNLRKKENNNNNNNNNSIIIIIFQLPLFFADAS